MNGFEPMSNGFEPMSLVLLKCQIVEEKDLINNFFTFGKITHKRASVCSWYFSNKTKLNPYKRLGENGWLLNEINPQDIDYAFVCSCAKKTELKLNRIPSRNHL